MAQGIKLKSMFGNWLMRLVRGGVVLRPAEQWLLCRLVANLPPHLKPVVDEQIASYNLAQREVDGRAINLYRRPAARSDMPLLDMTSLEAPLLRLTVSASDTSEPIHATLTAVKGRAFCMSLNRSVGHLSTESLQLVKVTEAWRSNFPAGAPNNSFKPTPLRGAA